MNRIIYGKYLGLDSSTLYNYKMVYFLPFAMADGSSYIPAIKATCPGLDSVGTFVWDTPQVPKFLRTSLR